MKKHNFNPGPAILPKKVLIEASKAVIDFNNSGLSILEMSHRSKDFIAVMDEAIALVKALLGLDDSYEVMFLSGGASTQFFMTAMNLLPEDKTACYVDTGTWANKAIKEAKLFGKIDVVASSKDKNYTFIPKKYNVPKDAVYLHLTSNNTIYGSQYHKWPETTVPIVCDMSSDIFSRPIDMKKFGLIYAGAQKNMGPAGVTLVVVKKDMLGKTNRVMPSMLNYQTHIAEGSMYNTPPVFPIYVAMLTMRWIKEKGGLAGMEKLNKAKANMLYKEIDTNPLFKCPVEKADRSWMNIVFLMENPSLEGEFNKACAAVGMEGLKGHRSVGGYRASMYNALPKSSVKMLVDVMQDFAKKHG